MIQKNVSRNDDDNKYAVDDLLQSDHFIRSQLYPTPESNAYWNDLLEKGIVDRKDYAFACRFIRSAQIRPEFTSDAEIFNLWIDIEMTNKATIKRKKKRSYIISVISGAVAMLAVILLITHIVPDKTEDFPPLFAAGSMLDAGTDIQLYLDDHTPVSLGGSEAKISYDKEDITINNNDMVLKKDGSPDKKNLFHQLVVPWGKRSMLTLYEGSRLWVNAGTRIVYPIEFDRKKREIYVDGEIYVEVSPDKDRPFIVKTTKMDVEVLGTTFNLTAYEKDNAQHVVLVTGSVKVRTIHQKNETVLSPNEMYLFSNGISKVQTVKAEDYISWKHGLYHYESKPLGEIMEHLSHYYGCAIVCSSDVSQMKFSGKLDLKDKLDTILKGISGISPITYQYNQGVYMITNK